MNLRRAFVACIAAVTLVGCVGCAGEPKLPETGRLAFYIRHAEEGYSDYKGQSVHIAYSLDGREYQPLYHNYGILFSKCRYNELDGIISTGVTSPAVYEHKGKYVIAGKEVERSFIADELVTKLTGNYVIWETTDFITFTEAEVTDSTKYLGKPITSECELAVHGAYCSVQMSVSGDILGKMIDFYAPITFESVSYPKEVEISSEAELDSIYATVTYSDGSTHNKKIELDKSKIDLTKSGSYKADGKITAVKMPFPLEERPWGDPVITEYEGKFYFFGTNDWETGCFEIRRADTLEGLFNGSEERAISLSDKDKKFSTTFCAPELHIINGNMYIFCAHTPCE